MHIAILKDSPQFLIRKVTDQVMLLQTMAYCLAGKLKPSIHEKQSDQKIST